MEEELGAAENGVDEMMEEDKTEIRQSSNSEEKKKRKRKRDGTRVTERDAFLVTALLRVRRLTIAQVAQLAFAKEETGRWIVRRLVSMELAEEQFVDRLHSDKSILLTDEGYRFACRRVGAEPSNEYFRDRIGWEQRVHALANSQLYVDFVTNGASSWQEARMRSDAFSWRVSNADTAFRWVEPRDVNKRVGRQVIPDITLETETTRYLIEVERPTKSLARVLSEKIAPYSHLFSLGRVVADRSAYAQKYPDNKKPVVVFVCHSNARAKSVQECFEKVAARPGFYVSSWRVGESSGIGAELAREVFGERAVVRASRDELQQWIRQIVEVAARGEQAALVDALLAAARSCVPAKDLASVEIALRSHSPQAENRRPRPAGSSQGRTVRIGQ